MSNLVTTVLDSPNGKVVAKGGGIGALLGDAINGAARYLLIA